MKTQRIGELPNHTIGINQTTLSLIAVLIVAAQYSEAAAQPGQRPPELTGTIWSDVSYPVGNVRSVELTIGEGGRGPFKAIMTTDGSLVTHTIYRPADLRSFGDKEKLPIVVYGNGACRDGSYQMRNLLSEVASHGFLVIAVGPIKNAIFGTEPSAKGVSDPKSLLEAVDWAVAQNANRASVLFGKVNTGAVAVMGQSCGGLMAMGASSDPRVTTTVMLNSGLFATPRISPNGSAGQTAGQGTRMSLPQIGKSELKKLHGPVVYFTGGEHDGATRNAADDYTLIDQVPVLHASYDFSEQVRETGNRSWGHYPATYREPDGGDFARAVSAWLQWQLKQDHEAAKMFRGNPCGLVKNPRWTVAKKKID